MCYYSLPVDLNDDDDDDGDILLHLVVVVVVVRTLIGVCICCQ